MFRREREKLQKLVLVPYRPFRNLSLGVGGVILIVVAGLVGFYLGKNYGIDVTGASPDEVQRLRQTVRMYADESQQLRDSASIATHDREIVLGATEQLRQENKNLLASMSALEEQVALYKRLLNPRAAASQGLSIEKFEVNATPVKGKFQYRLLLTQVSNNSTDTDVTVDVRLVGGGKSVKMPTGEGDNYKFQYFQNITGEWQLPAGFNPDSVDITVAGKGSKAARVQKRYKWEIKGM